MKQCNYNNCQKNGKISLKFYEYILAYYCTEHIIDIIKVMDINMNKNTKVLNYIKEHDKILYEMYFNEKSF